MSVVDIKLSIRYEKKVQVPDNSSDNGSCSEELSESESEYDDSDNETREEDVVVEKYNTRTLNRSNRKRFRYVRRLEKELFKTQQYAQNVQEKLQDECSANAKRMKLVQLATSLDIYYVGKLLDYYETIANNIHPVRTIDRMKPPSMRYYRANMKHYGEKVFVQETSSEVDEEEAEEDVNSSDSESEPVSEPESEPEEEEAEEDVNSEPECEEEEDAGTSEPVSEPEEEEEDANSASVHEKEEDIHPFGFGFFQDESESEHEEEDVDAFRSVVDQEVSESESNHEEEEEEEKDASEHADSESDFDDNYSGPNIYVSGWDSSSSSSS